MNLELKAFMTTWGNKFVSELKNQLLLKYPYAPGYNDNTKSALLVESFYDLAPINAQL